jgi:hypothetical protein
MVGHTAGCNDEPMIRHCVLLRFVDEAEPEQRQAVVDALAELPGCIDAIGRYQFGLDAGLADGNWDLGVTADFADAAAYAVYSGHPDHIRVITDHIKPILADRVAVQFELDD